MLLRHKIVFAITLAVTLTAIGGAVWDIKHQPQLRCPAGSAYVPRMEVCLRGAEYPIPVR